MLINSIANQDISNKNNRQCKIDTRKIFGFWIYLMSDLILFSCLFTTYIILVNGTAGGPDGKDIFNLKFVLVETFLLLFSSITYSFSMLAMRNKKINLVKLWLIITFFLGFSFLIMEIYEFYDLFHKGYSPDRSAFLSAFFTLVGMHGIHVIFGLCWIAVMVIHVLRNGLTSDNKTRLNCLNLFWHFLEIIWICVFTVIYLFGVIV
ncbi:MAG: cytochrome o ubiquinol oxidase subunit III [Arsenophonus sp.]